MRLSPSFHPSICSQRVWRDYAPVNIFFTPEEEWGWLPPFSPPPLNFLTSQHIRFFLARVLRRCCIGLSRRCLPVTLSWKLSINVLCSNTLDACGQMRQICLMKCGRSPPRENVQLRSKREARFCHVAWEENRLRWIICVKHICLRSKNHWHPSWNI